MYIVSVIVTISASIISVLGLVLLTGFTGLFSLGHAGFMSIGAYCAVLINRDLGVPYFAAIIIGAVLAMLIGALISYAPLRNKLRGDCFAISMLGFGTVVRLVFSNMSKNLFKGGGGISGIPRLTTLWGSLLLMVLMIYMMWCFIRSQYGRNCIAVQQQEIAAEMMGVNLVRTKMLSMMISAFYCGIAGAQLAFWLQYVSPTSFSDARSSNMLATLVTGGTNSLTGPVVAAAFLAFMMEYLRVLTDWRLVIYGLMLILIMRFRPEGLMGYREFSVAGFIRICKVSLQSIVELPAHISSFAARTRQKGDK